MNHYIEYFNYEAILFSGAYGALFCLVLWKVAENMGGTFKDRLCLIICYILFSSLVFVNAYTSLLPFFPDTATFALLVEENEVHTSSLGVNLYWIISTPIRLLSLGQLEAYLLWQCFFYFCSLLLLRKGWEIHCNYNNIPVGSFQIMIFLGVIYPAAIAFITIPLREFIQIFGFSLFIFGLAKYRYEKQIFWLIVGAILTIFVRPQLVVTYPFLVLIARQQNLVKLAILGVLSLPVAIVLFESVTGYTFSPSFFGYLRNAANEGYASSGMTYGAVQWNTYFDILIDLPKLALQFLLSPLPILHSLNPLAMSFAMADLLFLLVIFWGAFSVKWSYTHMYLKIFFLLTLIFSIWEFYIGGAVRHRFPLILMLLPIASFYFTHLINLFFNKTQKCHHPINS